MPGPCHARRDVSRRASSGIIRRGARRALRAQPRHFTRQFREATGTTPHQWLLTQRLALARRLLETTDQPIDHIAASTGFGTPAAMRLQFQQALDTSPAAYRRTFRTPSAA